MLLTLADGDAVLALGCWPDRWVKEGALMVFCLDAPEYDGAMIRRIRQVCTVPEG